MTLSDYKHLAHVIVLWQIQKFVCYCTVLLCFILYLRALSKYKPPEACIRRGDLTEVFLRYEFEGFIFGGAYFRNFTVYYHRSFNVSRLKTRFLNILYQ